MMRKSKMNVWEFMDRNPEWVVLLAFVALMMLDHVLNTLAR